MSNENRPNGPSAADPLRRRLGQGFAALWIFGAAIYFYIRFTLLFYQSNQAAIHGLIDRLREMLTLG